MFSPAGPMDGGERRAWGSTLETWGSDWPLLTHWRKVRTGSFGPASSGYFGTKPGTSALLRRGGTYLARKLGSVASHPRVKAALSIGSPLLDARRAVSAYSVRSRIGMYVSAQMTAPNSVTERATRRNMPRSRPLAARKLGSRARWLLEDAGGARNSEVSSFRVALPKRRIECLAQLLNLSKVSCSSMSAAHLRDVREIVVQSVPALFGQANECGPLVRRMRLPCHQLLLLQIFDPS